jgi:hypothetical protein
MMVRGILRICASLCINNDHPLDYQYFQDFLNFYFNGCSKIICVFLNYQNTIPVIVSTNTVQYQ